MAKDFLLEIGTEEIPAKFASGTMEQLRNQVAKRLDDLRIEHGVIQVFATPRRFAVIVNDLAERQNDYSAEVKGPAVKAAYDAEGNPTKAALGFAKGQGVEIDDLYQQELSGVPYVYARKVEVGKETAGLLPDVCVDLINSLHFPKPMRWGDLEMRFARPIRWLVALFGTEVVKFSLVGLASGKVSRGHRVLGREVTINSPSAYVESLRKEYVMVNPEERKDMIWQQVTALAAQVEGRVEEDEELLDEVTHIVEYPTAVLGEVPSRYMEMPDEVITTPMREHQRYFPISSAKGLLPYFIAISNGNPEASRQIKAGNEKVLKARLEDAAFYYREDQKVKLADLVTKLEKVVYHEKLGTVRERIERIRELSHFLSQKLGYGSAKEELIDRTAYLAKADLVTLMVYDFPELQGIMGGHYAKANGEEPEVCQGIVDHYKPRFAGDSLPESFTGQVVSVADKLDAIVGAFGIGIQPTGSQDPYALRRQAQGIVGIVLENEWDISMEELISESYKAFIQQGVKLLPLDDTLSNIEDFFQQRLRFVLQEEGLRYDTIDAVLAQGSKSLYRTAAKARILADKRSGENFEGYVQAYIRCLNLSKKATVQGFNPEHLEHETELALVQEINERRERFDSLMEHALYEEAYELASELVPMIEGLFDAVMIMVEDEKLKAARLGLLGQCVEMLGCIGDLSVLA